MSTESSSVEVEILKKVKIENFKSIKHLKLECKRVNVFIGEPNTGKSNIIEAIVGLPSSVSYEFKLQDAVRFERISDLFYDEIIDKEIKIKFDEKYIIIAEIISGRDKELIVEAKMLMSNNF